MKKMDKISKSTEAIKKEKPVRTSASSMNSTKIGAAGVKEKPNKETLSKSRKPVVAQSKPTKVLNQQKPISNAATSSLKSALNKPNRNEKSQNSTRAKNAANKVETMQKKNISTKVTTKNIKPNAVLDTFHNVTVSSPPALRKSTSKNAETNKGSPKSTSNEKRARTNTRTLEPEEVIVLRNESAKQRIQAEIKAMPKSAVKQPVAFEVEFENAKSMISTNKREEETRITEEEIENENYSDDFESYESDFESDTTSPATDTEDEPNVEAQNDVSLHNTECTTSESRNDEFEEEESEITQNPVTVIQRDKYIERKLDSGHYEINLTGQQQIFDSLDTFSGATSEQMDSGMSSYRMTIKKIEEKHEKSMISYGGYTDFLARPILSARGIELMSKIKFDILTFALFELKPITYDIYMQTYGKLNTTQTFTQTKENFTASEAQTDQYELRSKWTQHPPNYDIQSLQMLKDQLSSVNCCGELPESHCQIAKIDNYNLSCDLDSIFNSPFLQASRNLKQNLHVSKKSIDFNRLQTFLNYASNLMLKVLNHKSEINNMDSIIKSTHNSSQPILSSDYKQLDTNFLNALRVVHLFANSKHNIVITVHESLPEADVYRSDFSNLLMVWSINEIRKPIRLLSTWSEVCRAEICNDMQDIVVCGLRDGSVAMWDLRETYSNCSKLDGHLTHFAATQSIAPIWNSNAIGVEQTDLGAVVDIKSFQTRRKGEHLANATNNFKTLQFASLNDSGILVVWTLVDVIPNDSRFVATTSQAKEKFKSKIAGKINSCFEYSSPWARVKLVQSGICALRAYLESDLLKTPSNFDRAKLHFEKNIYNDEILRELNETSARSLKEKAHLQGLRFSCIDAGYDSIYVCTNRNFILICSKSLKLNKFRKISINESRFLFPTALRLLTHEHFLAVGLSNGSVMILNCNQKNYFQKAKQFDESFKDEEAIPKTTAKTAENSEVNLETGKSCAIQNIILKEKEAYERFNELDSYYRPTTTTSLNLPSNEHKPFELKVFDQQLLLSGSMLRKHLVQSLELSSDGRRLFALSDGEIRCYDFYLDRELLTDELSTISNEKSKVVDIAASSTSTSQKNLILLTKENFVQIHLLKQ